MRCRSLTALLVAASLCAGQNATTPATGSAVTSAPTSPPATNAAPATEKPVATHWWDVPLMQYVAPHVSEVPTSNSPRLESLIRGGNLYLSLSDAIALALENNLDVELQRWTPLIASSDLLRARGGGTLRGLPTSITELPSGIGGPVSPILNSPASGTIGGTTISPNLSNQSALVPTTTDPSIASTFPYSVGPPIPLYDPTLTGSLIWQHQSTPETNPLIAGANSLNGQTLTGNLGVDKGFSTGTQIGVSYNSVNQNNNSRSSLYNPYTTANLGLNVTQPLLRGFGPAVNRRFIRIAKNNEKISTLVFQEQVIETVSGVIRLYYDLVSLMEDVRVREDTLKTAQRLHEDNRIRVEQGTLAQIELVRAQAQVAAAQQDLANSESNELEQELILKNALTKNGTANPLVREARIIATDVIDVPPEDRIRPIDDLVTDAFANRPELRGARLDINNSHIYLQGTRNELLPEIDLVGTVQNSGLAGQVNPLYRSNGNTVSTPDPALLGGYGSTLGQIARRNYPEYGVGIQVNLPLRNRIAQADVVHDEAQVRRTEVRFQQLQNQVRLEVESALIAMRQARVALAAATQARKLQEQSLAIENERLAAGLSTTFLVLQYQSILTQARSTEVTARNVYIKARTSLERAVGTILDNHSIDEAITGQISRPPAALPPLK